jgi:hypothetical protein
MHLTLKSVYYESYIENILNLVGPKTVLIFILFFPNRPKFGQRLK